MKEFSKKISLCFMVLLGVLVMNLMVTELVWAADSDFVIDENGVLVEYIGSDSDVVIPEGVIEIGNNVFSWYTDLKSITIPNSVTRIGDYAFHGCTNLKSITIPDSVAYIGNWVFSYCYDLKSIVLSNTITRIGDYAFYDCCSLTSITIPDSVTSIGDYAFVYCTNLESVTIPNSITRIVDNPFAYCNNLININVGEQNINYKAEKGVLFSKDGTKLIAYSNGKSDSNYIIPESVITIGNSAFSSCNNLIDVTIPDSVTCIGKSAFESCGNLESIIVPNFITSISDYTFRNCTNLKSITIPESVINIGIGAFYACINLECVIIPESVTSIDGWAFAYCSSLTNIKIPNSVANIGVGAFQECDKLKSIFIYNHNIALGEGICGWNNELVTLYAHKGSNTEKYALQNGYNFKELEVLNPSITSSIVSIHPDQASMIENNIEVSGNTSIGMNLTITAGSGGKLSVQNGTGIELLCGQSEIEIATGSAIELEYLFDICVDEMDETQNIVFTLENITGEVCEQTEYMISKKESEPEPENKPLQSIRLSKTDINLVKDRTSLLKVFYDPEDTTDPRAVTWTSSNREVAIVYTNGKVKAIGKGTAVITAKVGNLTATCNVTVTE